MSKKLPYFQFEPAEYLTKDISFCTLSSQGLFINICAYYWQRNCVLNKTQLLKRLNYEKELNELINEGVVDIDGENIKIKFLDIQYEEIINLSNKNAVNGAKGGRPKKPNSNPNETQTKPNSNPNERHKIREDNIIQNKIKENEIKKENFVFEKQNENSNENGITIETSNLIVSEINKTFNKNCKQLTRYERELFNERINQGYTIEDFLTTIQNLKNYEFAKKQGYNFCVPEYISRLETLQKFSKSQPITEPEIHDDDPNEGRTFEELEPHEMWWNGFELEQKQIIIEKKLPIKI